MKLCRVLGMSLSESFERLSGDELDLWIAEYRIEPFGDDWLQAGSIAAAAANAFGGRRKPSDYIPTPPKKQTADEMTDIARGFARDHNARRK